jgi:hypothetical protein
MNCKHSKWKTIKTHGKKSRGYMVCKICDEVIYKKDLIKNKKNGRREKN